MTATVATLDDFVAAVGPDGPVAVRGGGGNWGVGGEPDADVREVSAPSGIVQYEPEEMTVTVGAGTPVAELHAVLADAGQRTTLPGEGTATVGGALAVGRDGIHRRGRGMVRDALLQARYVSAEGQLVTAGGPTVKNVTGFDLCRLLVGSLGTLGFLGEVILRTRPVAAASGWWHAEDTDPFALPALRTASSVLWDGAGVWLHLEGHPGDIEADASTLPGGFGGADGPPPLPPHRWALEPAAIRSIDAAAAGPFVAEVGVGTVHAERSAPAPPIPPAVRRLNDRIRQRFDPTGRLNPGRDPLVR